ncbi:MAG: YjjG family noncanonical pyrimidine nucleotidase [Clostridia bacterium]
MRQYDAILIDADDTLFDFAQAEHVALTWLLDTLQLNTERARACYHACNRACWAALEKGEIDQARLRYKRFEDFFRAMDVSGDPIKIADGYMALLSRQGMLLSGALAAVREIAREVPVAVVTNGISFIQHGRMDASPLRPYVSAFVISEELGVAKPHPKMISAALKLLGGVSPTRALMVGDSIPSDLYCARNAGTDACWYNPSGAPRPKDVPIRYEISALAQLPALALIQT